MQTFYKGRPGHEFNYKGFDFIVYENGRKTKKWLLVFPAGPIPGFNPGLIYKNRDLAIKAAETLINNCQ